MKNIAHCNLITNEHGVAVLDADLNYIEVRMILPEELVESSKTTPIQLLKIDDSGTTTVGEFSSLDNNEIVFNLAETINSYEAATFKYQISDGNYTSEPITFNIEKTLDVDSDEIYIDYINNVFEIVKGKKQVIVWHKAELTNSFKIYGDDNNVVPEYSKDGNFVEIRGQITPKTAITSGGKATIFTLPEGYRPSKTVHCYCQGSSKNSWLLVINASGEVGFERYGADSNIETPVGAWLAFHMIFTTN